MVLDMTVGAPAMPTYGTCMRMCPFNTTRCSGAAYKVSGGGGSRSAATAAGEKAHDNSCTLQQPENKGMDSPQVVGAGPSPAADAGTWQAGARGDDGEGDGVR